MKYRLGYALLPLALFGSLFFVTPASATQKAEPTAVDCAVPEPVKELAKIATKIERVGKAVRFYVPDKTEAADLGLSSLNSPPVTSGGYNWFHKTQMWVEWVQSFPCSGPDDYGFGMSHQCYKRPTAGGGATAVLCNIQAFGTLQIEYGAGWDTPWGTRRYYELSTPSCLDTGNFHAINDAAHVHIRSWTQIGVRFVDNQLLSGERRTTSYHINAATKALSGNPIWYASGNDPEPSTLYPC